MLNNVNYLESYVSPHTVSIFHQFSNSSGFGGKAFSVVAEEAVVAPSKLR